MAVGRIVKNISDSYTVFSNNNYYVCKARGKFRNTKTIPLVGDIVEFNESNCYILKILPRKNSLIRPNISNIDIALIITSLKQPDLSLSLLDKEISSIILSKVEPVICFTKLDLGTSKELKELQKLKSYYESIGLKVFANDNLKPLITYLQGKYVVLTGQTGAGKSSFLNKLNPSLNLKTSEISLALNRGKHTTRHIEFYLYKDIYIADTPGFSALDLKAYNDIDIRNSFLEFRDCICEFKDCKHIKEEICEVKKRVDNGQILASRYANYCSFLRR